MKIKISITKAELLALLVKNYTPYTKPEDVELEIIEVDCLADYRKMFGEITELRSRSEIIPAIRLFREKTGFSLVIAKYACGNLQAYITQSEQEGKLDTNFMGYSAH